MTSLKVKLRFSMTNPEMGKIYYQIIHNRVVKNIRTEYRISAKEWDEKKGCIKAPYPNGLQCKELEHTRVQIQKDIMHLQSCIDIYEQEGKEFHTTDIIRMYREHQKKDSLTKFTLNLISCLQSQGQVRTGETYYSALRSFIRFRNGKEISLKDINREVIGQYELYLKNKGLTLNSISFYMRILRAVYNRAVESGLTPQRNPFKHVYTGIEKTAKRAVPIQTIKCIKQLPLPEASTLDYARDMFLFSFYTRGMSFIDIAYLKKKDLHNGILKYRRKKTGQLLSIKWEKCMQDILNKYAPNATEYLLPIIVDHSRNERRQYKNALTLVNRRLKLISKKIHSTSPLSMYVARHSWASIAHSKHIPISIISEGMGHDSESTTQIYLAALDTSVVDRANSAILRELK